MDKAILAAYSGLTATCVLIFILGLTILYRSYIDGSWQNPDKKSTFYLALSIVGWFGAESILRGWWTVWKSSYMSRDAVSWMYDHTVVLCAVCVMIGSGILFIKSLTDDSPHGRLWILCAGVIFSVIFLGYVR